MLKIQIGFCQSSHAKIIRFKYLKLCASQVIKLAVFLHYIFSSIHLSINVVVWILNENIMLRGRVGVGGMEQGRSCLGTAQQATRS